MPIRILPVSRLTLTSSVACLLSLPGFAETFSYTDFSNLSTLQLNGSANSIGNPIFDGSQNVLRLTDSLSQSGSAFRKSPITLTDGGGFEASFSTFFKFRISNPIGISDDDGQGADGLVFVVQTVSNTSGGSGGGIGYSGIANSVGVEYDTYNNGAFGNDPNGNHVGIDVGGNIFSAATVIVPDRMNDGDVWYSWVDYNGSTDTLEVRLSETPARPAAPFLSHLVDLPAVLGVPDAFVGFTSGTGGAGGNHDILSWQFDSTYNPINPVIPEGRPLIPALGVLGLLAFRQLRKQVLTRTT